MARPLRCAQHRSGLQGRSGPLRGVDVAAHDPGVLADLTSPGSPGHRGSVVGETLGPQVPQSGLLLSGGSFACLDSWRRPGPLALTHAKEEQEEACGNQTKLIDAEPQNSPERRSRFRRRQMWPLTPPPWTTRPLRATVGWPPAPVASQSQASGPHVGPPCPYCPGQVCNHGRRSHRHRAPAATRGSNMARYREGSRFRQASRVSGDQP